MSAYILNTYKNGKTLYPTATLNTIEAIKHSHSWSLSSHYKTSDDGKTYTCYRLHSDTPRTYSDFMSYDVICPKCGQRMHPVAVPYDYHDLGLYTCSHCNKN